MKTIMAVIKENRNIQKGYFVMSLENRYLAKKASPGQFVNILVSDSGSPFLRRPFGIHKIEKKLIKIFYKVVGQGTVLLSQKTKGDRLNILGPLGKGFNIEPFGKKADEILIVAGGHGVAPMLALCDALKKADKNMKITVFLGAKTGSHVVGGKAFKLAGVKTKISTDDGSKGSKGLVTKNLWKHVKKIKGNNIAIYACGPNPLLKSVAQKAAKKKIWCEISMEEYLACGIGVCMGCAISTTKGRRLICKDGPVFQGEEILW